MNKTIKSVLLIVGLVLTGYGIFMLVQPEVEVLGIIEAQDNTNAYITIGIGVVAMALGLLGGKK